MRKLTALFLLFTLLVLSLPACAETGAEEPREPIPFPVLSTEDLEGNPVDMSLLEGATFVLLNIWEPWCGPCKSEMPGMSELYEKYKDRGLLIIGVSGMSSIFPDETIQVNRDLKVTYPLIRYQEGMLPFEIQYFPTTFGYSLSEDGSFLLDGYLEGALEQSDWEAIITYYLPDPENEAAE